MRFRKSKQPGEPVSLFTKEVTYVVRAVKDGKMVYKKKVHRENRALRLARKAFDKGQTVVIRPVIKKVEPRIYTPSEWGIADHDAWERTGAVSDVYQHTTVTEQLPVTAKLAEEKAQIRNVDAIAHSRGFNGVSYGYMITPSGNIFEGRGFGVVEAAQEGFNTTGDSVAFVGNNDVFPLTSLQKQSEKWLLKHKANAGKLRRPVRVKDHRDVAAKACPGAKVPVSWKARVSAFVNKVG